MHRTSGLSLGPMLDDQFSAEMLKCYTKTGNVKREFSETPTLSWCLYNVSGTIAAFSELAELSSLHKLPLAQQQRQHCPTRTVGK